MIKPQRRTSVLVIISLVGIFFTVAVGQPHKPSPIVSQMVKQVSEKNIEATIRKLVSFGTRNTLSEQNNPSRGIGAARDWIFAEFQRISSKCGGCLDVQKQTFLQPVATRVPTPTNITNVYAVLKGTTDPDRVYVVSGHYDSMCTSPTDAKCDAPGANDDASGTAVSIELARVMSRHRFDATIVFMAVAGEEQGLLGSTYYAEQAKVGKQNIEAMLTNDIVGGVTSQKFSRNRNKVRVFSEGVPTSETEAQARTRRSVGGENDSPSRQLARFIKEQADLYLKRFGVWLIYRRDRYLRGGDHIPFLERGFTAVRFTEADEDYSHQHKNVETKGGVFFGDTMEYVDPLYTANVCRVNLITLASLALAPAKPSNVQIVTSSLTNDTELTWDSNKDADLAGYEVVRRETSSPIWTSTFKVGLATSYTAKGISKDNYFFGVRAVDRDGNRSPVVFPLPSR
jgi:Zn-dependent M28 family amino/carboxypeptidase